MKYALSFVLILICVAAARAQGQAASGGSNGLRLGQTTAAEAVAMFGKPARDKGDDLSVLKVGKWLKREGGEKGFRVLTFEQVADLEKAELAFLDDRLVSIHFFLKKKLPARNLPAAYRAGFTPFVRNPRDDWGPSDYERNKSGSLLAYYPDTYYLLSVSKESIIVARVFNSGADPDLPLIDSMIVRRSKDREGKTVTAEAFRGDVKEVQIISRALEKAKADR